MTIKTKQGARGKWYWQLVDGSTHKGISAIGQYDTRADAVKAAADAFGDAVYIEARRWPVPRRRQGFQLKEDEMDKKKPTTENAEMGPIRKLFAFKKPRLAIIALVLTAFSLSLAIYPMDSIEKFGYLIAMGFGVGFLVAGAKSMMAEFGNLAVLMAVLGVAQVLAAVFATPDSVFAASALEEEAAIILGAGLGFFSKVEEG